MAHKTVIIGGSAAGAAAAARLRRLSEQEEIIILEKGKDGDVVIADGDPMLSNTKVEAVFLNGKKVVG